MVRAKGKDEKARYEDVCFPVTKEFREKLYDAVWDCYHAEKKKAMNQAKEQAYGKDRSRIENRQPKRGLPFR